ncbi:hypothetical protein K490DRAFT_68000 [Saccharata proteae CBS 121410]|uniref:Uncharacterized protein n=1 Tax=Saccharata proteae CBS 121410 TaxID=1314787 RepID=A0A9P4HR19_9PEZI|nr:hypothetical protein K490DRAFT_68000 [Saccharata proteae CBS 121410]
MPVITDRLVWKAAIGTPILFAALSCYNAWVATNAAYNANYEHAGDAIDAVKHHTYWLFLTLLSIILYCIASLYRLINSTTEPGEANQAILDTIEDLRNRMIAGFGNINTTTENSRNDMTDEFASVNRRHGTLRNDLREAFDGIHTKIDRTHQAEVETMVNTLREQVGQAVQRDGVPNLPGNGNQQIVNYAPHLTTINQTLTGIGRNIHDLASKKNETSAQGSGSGSVPKAVDHENRADMVAAAVVAKLRESNVPPPVDNRAAERQIQTVANRIAELQTQTANISQAMKEMGTELNNAMKEAVKDVSKTKTAVNHDERADMTAAAVVAKLRESELVRAQRAEENVAPTVDNIAQEIRTIRAEVIEAIRRVETGRPITEGDRPAELARQIENIGQEIEGLRKELGQAITRAESNVPLPVQNQLTELPAQIAQVLQALGDIRRELEQARTAMNTQATQPGSSDDKTGDSNAAEADAKEVTRLQDLVKFRDVTIERLEAQIKKSEDLIADAKMSAAAYKGDLQQMQVTANQLSKQAEKYREAAERPGCNSPEFRQLRETNMQLHIQIGELREDIQGYEGILEWAQKAKRDLEWINKYLLANSQMMDQQEWLKRVKVVIDAFASRNEGKDMSTVVEGTGTRDSQGNTVQGPQPATNTGIGSTSTLPTSSSLIPTPKITLKQPFDWSEESHELDSEEDEDFQKFLQDSMFALPPLDRPESSSQGAARPANRVGASPFAQPSVPGLALPLGGPTPFNTPGQAAAATPLTSSPVPPLSQLAPQTGKQTAPPAPTKKPTPTPATSQAQNPTVRTNRGGGLVSRWSSASPEPMEPKEKGAKASEPKGKGKMVDEDGTKDKRKDGEQAGNDKDKNTGTVDVNKPVAGSSTTSSAAPLAKPVSPAKPAADPTTSKDDENSGLTTAKPSEKASLADKLTIPFKPTDSQSTSSTPPVNLTESDLGDIELSVSDLSDSVTDGGFTLDDEYKGQPLDIPEDQKEDYVDGVDGPPILRGDAAKRFLDEVVRKQAETGDWTKTPAERARPNRDQIIKDMVNNYKRKPAVKYMPLRREIIERRVKEAEERLRRVRMESEKGKGKEGSEGDKGKGSDEGEGEGEGKE